MSSHPADFDDGYIEGCADGREDAVTKAGIIFGLWAFFYWVCSLDDFCDAWQACAEARECPGCGEGR